MGWGPPMDPPPFDFLEELQEELGDTWQVRRLCWWPVRLAGGRKGYRITFQAHVQGKYVWGRTMVAEGILKALKHPWKVVAGAMVRTRDRILNPQDYRVQKYMHPVHGLNTGE